MAREEDDNVTITDKDTLLMMSGVALMVFGAGLVFTNPTVKRYLGRFALGDLAQATLPDIDRYLKIRSM